MKNEEEQEQQHPVVAGLSQGTSGRQRIPALPPLELAPSTPTTDTPGLASQRIHTGSSIQSLVIPLGKTFISNMAAQAPKQALVFGASAISGWAVSTIAATSFRGSWLKCYRS